MYLSIILILGSQTTNELNKFKIKTPFYLQVFNTERDFAVMINTYLAIYRR